jgi:large subunit ribosomal protein L17
MMHQNGHRKLNRKESHRRAMVRNQVLHLIEYGHLTTTKARVKEVQKVAERAVTVARTGNDFNARRRLHALLPYKPDIVLKLVKDIAPRYVNRPGGYTRTVPLGRRVSDTAVMARLEWVQ